MDLNLSFRNVIFNNMDTVELKLKKVKINNVSKFNNLKFKNFPLYYSLDMSGLKNIQLIPMGYKPVDPELSELLLNSNISIIGDGAFEGCSNLTKVTGQPKSIGKKAFFFCLKLKEFPFEQVEELDSSSFEYTSLTTFKAAGNLETVPESCFSCCYFLKDIDLNHVRTIEHHAFELCTMTHIVLPKTLKKIGNFAFKNCTFLENIVSLSEEPPSICENTFSGSSIKNIWVVSPEAATKYISCKHWSKYADKIKVLDLSQFTNDDFL